MDHCAKKNPCLAICLLQKVVQIMAWNSRKMWMGQKLKYKKMGKPVDKVYCSPVELAKLVFCRDRVGTCFLKMPLSSTRNFRHFSLFIEELYKNSYFLTVPWEYDWNISLFLSVPLPWQTGINLVGTQYEYSNTWSIWLTTMSRLYFSSKKTRWSSNRSKADKGPRGGLMKWISKMASLFVFFQKSNVCS